MLLTNLLNLICNIVLAVLHNTTILSDISTIETNRSGRVLAYLNIDRYAMPQLERHCGFAEALKGVAVSFRNWGACRGKNNTNRKLFPSVGG